MNNLLVFLVSACLVAAALADKAAVKKVVDDAAAQCKTELGTNDDDIKVVYNKDIPKNEGEACILDCIAKKTGVIKDGALDHQGVLNMHKVAHGEDKQKLEEAENLYKACLPEVQKRASEKCGAGIAMRECVSKFFQFNKSQ